MVLRLPHVRPVCHSLRLVLVLSALAACSTPAPLLPGHDSGSPVDSSPVDALKVDGEVPADVSILADVPSGDVPPTMVDAGMVVAPDITSVQDARDVSVAADSGGPSDVGSALLDVTRTDLGQDAGIDVSGDDRPADVGAEDCGSVGHSCCVGNACDPGATCVTGNVCAACGGVGQVCCGGSGCGDDGLCAPNGLCRSCGGADQPCCSGSRCITGAVCTTTSGCQPCGGSGQPCCAGSLCGSGLGCTLGLCGECGGRNQPCCQGTSCGAGLVCAGTDVRLCQCGREHQPCCGPTFPGTCTPAAGMVLTCAMRGSAYRCEQSP